MYFSVNTSYKNIMIITDFLERNAREFPNDIALVEMSVWSVSMNRFVKSMDTNVKSLQRSEADSKRN